MSRRRGKVQRSAGKARRIERRATRRRTAEAILHEPYTLYMQAVLIGLVREQAAQSVVCETCGFEQDYRTADEDADEDAAACTRGPALGLPCEGTVCISAKHYREATLT